MRIDDIVSEYVHLGKPSGGNVQGKCPFHDDGTPSFNVTPSAGLYHCFGCGESGDAITFIRKIENLEFVEAVEWLAKQGGLQLRYVDEPAGPRSPRKAAGRGSGVFKLPKGRLPATITTSPEPETKRFDHQKLCWPHEVTAYPYVDEHGLVLGESVRLACQEPGKTKCFTQRHVDEQGRTIPRQPSRRVPYCLPAVLDAVEHGRTIWLTEGEKDADRLTDLGEAATTNLGGATSFNEDLVPYFAGGHVHVVLDRDRAGYQRADRLQKLLEPVVASLRFSVAADTVQVAKADLSDHLDAGLGLDDLVAVTIEDARGNLAIYQLRDLVRKARLSLDEAAAQHSRGEDAALSARARGDARRYATRWAYHATKHAHEALGLAEHVLATDIASVLAEQVRTEALTCVQVARQAWTAAEADQPVAVGEVLDASALRVPALGGEDEAVVDNVVAHPTATRQAPPPFSIPMSRGEWRYSLGQQADGNARGVYRWERERWVFTAPLPDIRGRIIRRNGRGDRSGTDYLLAATARSRAICFTHQALKDGLWANELGVVLSDDPTIVRAVSTAIRDAAEHSPETEAVLRVPRNGKALIPATEVLPSGYLELADCSPEEAHRIWRQIVIEAAASSKIALLLGASASAPYIGPLGRQSHIINLYGDPSQGKTVTLQLLGSIWGNPTDPQHSLVQTWSTTPIATVRELGNLGVLPAFFDEKGAMQLRPQQWAQLIYQISQGAKRTVSKARSAHETSQTLGWLGVMFATGNGRIGRGLGAGDYAGVHRRLIELETPLTCSPAHSDRIKRLTSAGYGHLGRQILDNTEAADIQSLIDQAARDLGGLEEDTPAQHRELAKHLHGHLAGALLVDQLLGTDRVLYDSALLGAQDILQAWAEPQHDADRVLDLLRDALIAEPARWPARRDYLQLFEPFDATSPAAPTHGVSRDEVRGVIDDNDEWLAVLPRYITPELDRQGIDDSVAWRELYNRGHLIVAKSCRQKGEYVTTAKFHRATRCYKIRMSAFETVEPASQEELMRPQAVEIPTESPEVTGAVTGAVTGQVTGETGPLTSEVTQVTGPRELSSRTCAREEDLKSPADHQLLETAAPCVACGQSCVLQIDGQVLHAMCELPNPNATPTVASATAATLTPPPPGEGLDERWAGPLVVADLDGVHLPSGTTVSLPDPLTSWVQLADLAREHRIGWGGTTASLPEAPHIVITRDLAIRLGIPPEPFDDDSADAHATAVLPVQRNTRDAGWELLAGDQDGDWRIRPWMRLALRGPGGYSAFIVLPHLLTDDILDALYDQDTPADEIVARARYFAELAGIPYRISPGVTGLDLATSLRRNAGHNGSRPLPILRDPVEAPTPAQMNGVSFDMLVRRLPADDEAAAYVTRWDTNNSYLRAFGEVRLGLDVPAQHFPNGCDIDLKAAGYWRIKAPNLSWLDPRCPSPLDASFEGGKRPRAKDWHIVTTPKLRLLVEELDIEPEVLEAWLWTDTTKYFGVFNTRMRKVLAQNWADIDLDNPLARAIQPTLKALYKAGSGRLKANRPGHPLHRPDYLHTIYDEAYRHTWRNVYRIGSATGQWPLAVHKDCLWYASDDPASPPDGLSIDPRQIGKYKFAGSAPMAQAMPFLAGETSLDKSNDVFQV